MSSVRYRPSHTNPPPDTTPRSLTSTHIFPTSATMVGICITLLSLSRLDDDQVSFWLIDKLIVIDAVVFLASCLLSFLAVRATGRVSERELRLERRAEIVFMLGIALLAIGAVLLAFVVT